VPLVVDMTVKVEVPVPPLAKVTLVGLRDPVRPEGETVDERETVPVKPKRLVTLAVDNPEDPACAITLAGLAETLKLGGLIGLSLVNFSLVGAEVPSTYNRSTVTPAPVALTDNP
jgi:hypothetical protein